MEEIGKLTSQPQWNYNPYVKNDKKAVVLHSDGDTKILSKMDNFNPYKDIHGMAIVREVDNDKFVKLYTGNLGAWFELSVPAQKVLQYILMVLPKNTDQVFLQYEQVRVFSGYKSFSSVYEAINELINKKIIARSKYKEMFFINPAFVFNGDRVIFSEAIVRNSQAIAERNKMLGELQAEESVHSDSEAVALEHDPGAQSFFDRAREQYQ